MNNEGPEQLSVQPLGGRSGPAESFDGILRMPTAAEALDTTLAPRGPAANEPDIVIVNKVQDSWRVWAARLGVGALALLIIAGGTFILVRRAGRSAPVQSGSFSTVHLPLGRIAKTPALSVSSSA